MDGTEAIRVLLEAEAADDVRSVVLAGLKAFNRRHAAAPEFRELLVSARDADGRIVGGLVGETGWSWLHVKLLWIEEELRGRGVGTRVLAAAEREAIARGCGDVHLDTFDFQARPFYERQGYVVFGVLDGYPPGSSRHFLRKTLAPR